MTAAAKFSPTVPDPIASVTVSNWFLIADAIPGPVISEFTLLNKYKVEDVFRSGCERVRRGECRAVVDTVLLG